MPWCKAQCQLGQSSHFTRPTLRLPARAKCAISGEWKERLVADLRRIVPPPHFDDDAMDDANVRYAPAVRRAVLAHCTEYTDRGGSYYSTRDPTYTPAQSAACQIDDSEHLAPPHVTERPMVQRSYGPIKPTIIDGPICTRCGAQMVPASVEPSSPGVDHRTFECKCGHIEMMNVE
jgi:hypothetical protein